MKCDKCKTTVGMSTQHGHVNMTLNGIPSTVCRACSFEIRDNQIKIEVFEFSGEFCKHGLPMALGYDICECEISNE